MTAKAYMETHGIRVIQQDLPCTVRGFVVNDDPDGFCIIVNSRHTREQQQRTIRHELGHIQRGEVGDPAYTEY